MAAKRLWDGETDADRGGGQSSNEKKRNCMDKESSSVNYMQSMLAKIEPVLQRVVREEVQRSFFQFSPSLSNDSKFFQKQIQQTNIDTSPSPTFNLIFPNRLALPIFTSNKISDVEGNPLQIILKTSSSDQKTLIHLPWMLELEIVVLNGDFSVEEGQEWTSEEFEKNIVKEREGKRPLITGDVEMVMKDGCAVNLNNIMITDNSSWMRSRHFRIGARVSPRYQQGLRIQEAITEKFVVKDHRGELCKKSHPPNLDDEVWRLEKIGKEGKLHKRLVSAGIKTVQDFLKLWVVRPDILRKILGPGMADKAWDVTTKHANNCVLDNKQYIYHKNDITIVLNSICQVVDVTSGGVSYSPFSLQGVTKTFVNQMVTEALTQWNSLEVVDDLGSNIENSLLTAIPSSSDDQINSSYLTIDDFDVCYN